MRASAAGTLTAARKNIEREHATLARSLIDFASAHGRNIGDEEKALHILLRFLSANHTELPVGPNEPVRYERASEWLLRAEKLAGVPKQKGSLWHAYRRKWATERKHLPDVDVAAAGGWTETSSLKRCYQQADEATMLEVVLGGGELRESRG